MDLADVTVVALAEEQGDLRIALATGQLCDFSRLVVSSPRRRDASRVSTHSDANRSTLLQTRNGIGWSDRDGNPRSPAS
jgi:hypothetical protein